MHDKIESQRTSVVKDKTCGGQHHGIEINLLNGNCYSIEVGTSEKRGVWEETSGYLAPPSVCHAGQSSLGSL